MKYFVVLIACLLFSCNGLKKTIKDDNLISGKLDIKLSSEAKNFNVKGVVYSTLDSTFFNIFGPLGISLLKVKIASDSVFILDIQNKRFYRAFSKNISKHAFGIFKGEFSSEMSHLICTLFNFAEGNTDGGVKCFEGGRPTTFNYKVYSGKLILNLFLNNSIEGYMITIKVLPNSSDSGFFDIGRYKSYEIINIKLI